jgi:UDP-N-acetylglucosamine 3-dehydrogenase
MIQEGEKKLRFGQIGCGDIARIRYFPSYPAARSSELGAVCDPDPVRLEQIRSLFPEAVCYDSYRALLQDQSVDAVVITTPPGTHRVIATEAARAGKHILLEKPMVLTLEDADAVMAAAENAGVSLLAMPFDQLRTLMETNRIIQEGRIGRPVSFEATVVHNGTNHSPWFYRRGGGVLSDLAIYPISWITGLVGAAARVSAISSTVVPERMMLNGSVVSCEVEDNLVVTLQWNDGTLATIVSNCTTGGLGEVYQAGSWRGKRIFNMNIYGREGFIHLNFDDRLIAVSSGRSYPRDQEGSFGDLIGYSPKLTEYSELSARTGNGPEILNYFCQNIVPRKTLHRSVYHQRHVVEIIECAQVSIESGKVQPLTTQF